MPSLAPLPRPITRAPLRARLQPATISGPTPRRLCLAIALALGTALPAGPAAAAELTWNGLFGSPFWSARFFGVSNWNDGQTPQDGDSLVFGGSVGLLNNNDYAGLTVSRLSFATNAGAFTIGGLMPTAETRMRLTGSLINNSNNLQTLNLGIDVRDSGLVWDGGAGGLAVNGSLFLGSSSSLTLRNTTQVNHLGSLTVGASGSNSLNIFTGSKVSTQGGAIGEGTGSRGAVSLSDAGSAWSTGNRSLEVGGLGSGSLTIDLGATVSSVGGVIGSGSAGQGTVSVRGANSAWTMSGDLRVGLGGSGSLTIAQGGTVSNRNATIGPPGGRASGSVLVTGAHSRWLNSGTVEVGAAVGTGQLQIENGGFVSSREGFLGGQTINGSLGSALVRGAGAQWAVTGELFVGNVYSGTLTVDNGGLVTSSNARIGGAFVGPRESGQVTLQDAGSRWVNSGRLAIGYDGAGTLNIANGATAEVGGALRVGASGVLNLRGGTLQINDAALEAGGQFNWTAGTLRFTNPGATLGAGLFQLGSTTTLASNQVLEFSQSFAVGSGNQLLLAGGTLGGNGTGTLLNDGHLAGFGALSGSGGFTNTSALVQSGGNLVLSNTGANSNTGNWDLAAGKQLQLASATLTNHGTLALNGGTVSGSGTLVNAADGVVTGRGGITSNFSNAGVLALESGTTTIGQAFVNQGQIQIASNTAALAGALVNNSGHIEGFGRVGNAVNNTGTLEAMGGTLTFAGALSNTGGGVMAAGSGTKLVVLQGLARNEAQISLAGGTLDNNGAALVNGRSGTITGWGTLRSGSLTNEGRLLLAGGTTALHADVRASAGSQMILSGQSNTTFHGAVDVQSDAELRVSQGSVATFFGMVNQRTGAVLTGTGSKYYEGGLAIGNSPGLGLDAGSVTFGASNVYTAEVAGTDPGDALGIGIQFDRYVAAGTLSFGGTLKLVTLNGFAPQVGQSFDLFDWGSRQGQFASLDFTQAPLAAGLAWDTTRLYVDGSLQVAAVPEPASLALLMAGLGLVGLQVRRRGRQAGS